MPPQTFSSPAPELNYAIGSIVLSSVVIPPEHLIVTISGKSVTVKASQVSLAHAPKGERGMEEGVAGHKLLRGKELPQELPRAVRVRACIDM